MPYLGRSLTAGNYLKLDDISSQFNGTTTTFNLTSGGQPFYAGSAYSILVSLAGVVQQPESAYQINENRILFATAPQSTDVFFCIALGLALGIGVPGDGTVDGTKLNSIITWDTLVDTDHFKVTGKISSEESAIFMNPNSITRNTTIPTDYNAQSVGPSLTVDSGVSVTVSAGGEWTIT
jgi:hypothetical protein